MVARPFNPQNLNRYSYVLNNPLRYTDSTGHCIDRDTGNLISGLYPWGTSGLCPDDGGSSTSTLTSTSTPLRTPSSTTQTLLPIPTSTSAGTLTHSFTQASLISTISIPILPPSPFACEWVDCALSAISTIASGFTLAPAPQIAGPAVIIDVVATGIALAHTYDDYQQGEISLTTAAALAGTGAAGIYPGPIGFGFSIMNSIVTIFGFPYP